jgi:hypothetical protein
MMVNSLLWIAVATAALQTVASLPECVLDCQNGGYCSYVAVDEAVLAKEAQTGKLVQKCVCRPGWGGTGCELVIEQCSFPKRKCHNGMPCSRDEVSGEYRCDCADAEKVGYFAGVMCRTPYTEYCGGSLAESTNYGFCTNGGTSRCFIRFFV